VLRTDFSDAVSWESICIAIRESVGEFKAYVDFVSDPEFDDVSTEQLLSMTPQDFIRSFMFVVDHVAISRPDHPVLVLDLFTEPGRTFRVLPSEVWGVENNLSISNMDFAEFADAVDQDGVFRGFPGI
jgi:hypothetical protein